MVGGIDYEFSQFNRVTQAQRQPGSAFKLFVAATALEEGYTPDSTLEDTPLAIEGWVPENFHDQHLGTVTLQQAFAQSLNVPMVRLAQAVGISKVTALARAMGIKSPIRQNLSSALGSSEVNLLELTSAYATVAAEGYQVRPYGVVRITTKKGRELYVTPNRLTKRVLSPVGLAGLQQLLSSVLYSPGGTGTAARLDAIAGGKTGTSQNFRDAWFLGSAEDITTGVWMGNDDNTPMDRVTGGSLPARVWATYMRQALQLQNDIQ
jgi:penicillin-binding protein 1A